MIKLVLPLLLGLGLQAQTVTLDDLEGKPPGRAKNFLISLFLKQDISPADARRAFYQYKDVTKSVFLRYAEKTDEEEVKEVAGCWSMSAKKMLEHPDDMCALLSLSPYAAALLQPEDRVKLARRYQHTDNAYWLNAMIDPLLDDKLESYEARTFLRLFNGTGSNFRQEHFNRRYSAEFIEKLEHDWRFSRFVETVVHDDDYRLIQLSLLDAPGIHVNAKTAFWLAMNNIRYDQKHEALRLLDIVHDKSYYRIDRDKALFWKYLISDDSDILERLTQSNEINIYTLYAKELLGQPIDNYFTYLKTTDEPAPYDITDPFVWSQLLDDIRDTPRDELYDLAASFQSYDMLGVQAFILERASGYTMHNFIMPYQEYLQGLDTHEKAILYALMRQESRFIPSALSRSYALGLMQMMPFLVKAMDKDFKEKRNSFFDMFKPEMNLKYAIRHLDWLEKRVYHPLFIAYAYNGGIGFTRKHLKSGTFLPGKYEPFWSMEMMKNSESREYGKKVLANYVVYRRILGEPVTIRSLFRTLTQPSQTDRFRKEALAAK